MITKFSYLWLILKLKKCHFLCIYLFYNMFWIWPLFESMQNCTHRSMFFECLLSGGSLLQIPSSNLLKSCISAGFYFLMLCTPETKKLEDLSLGCRLVKQLKPFLESSLSGNLACNISRFAIVHWSAIEWTAKIWRYFSNSIMKYL